METRNLEISKRQWIELLDVEDGCLLSKTSGAPFYYFYSALRPSLSAVGHLFASTSGEDELIGGRIWVRSTGVTRIAYTPAFIGAQPPGQAIGDLTALHTTNQTNLVAALNEMWGIMEELNPQVMDGLVGDLTTLTTTDKTNIVHAINEVRSGLATTATTLVNLINDSLGAGTTDHVWSIDKVVTYVQSVKSQIMGGIAPEVFDTITELANWAQTSDGALSTFTNALSAKVDVNTAQSFNSTQMTQARSNIAAASQAAVTALTTTVNNILTSLNNDSAFYTTMQTALNARVLNSDIVDTLTSTESNKPLSAKQGNVLYTTKVATSAVGAASGVAPLDSNQRVPAGNLPPVLESTGILHGGSITQNADPTRFDVAELIAGFVDYSNPALPIRTAGIYGPYIGVSVVNIATHPVTYLGVNAAGDLIQFTAPLTPTQRRTYAELGAVIHTNLTTIITTNCIASTIRSGISQLHDFMEAVGPLNLTGNVFTGSPGTLCINKTAGRVFKFGANFQNNHDDPHRVLLGESLEPMVRYRTRDSEISGDVQYIDPDQYDFLGALTTVPPGRYHVQHLVVFQSGLVRIQYAQEHFPTMATAIDSLTDASTSYIVETNMADNGVLRCYLALRKGATDLTNPLDAVFVHTGKFIGTSSTVGAALTLSNILAALGYTPVSDVDMGDPETDFVAVFNAALL